MVGLTLFLPPFKRELGSRTIQSQATNWRASRRFVVMGLASILLLSRPVALLHIEPGGGADQGRDDERRPDDRVVASSRLVLVHLVPPFRLSFTS